MRGERALQETVVLRDEIDFELLSYAAAKQITASTATESRQVDWAISLFGGSVCSVFFDNHYELEKQDKSCHRDADVASGEYLKDQKGRPKS